MSRTEMGVLTHGNLTPPQLATLMADCEQLGFGTLWHADERFFRDPWASLAYAATRSDSIRIGVCVTDPYVRHPALTASAAATVDEISNGRLVLGLGSGISGFREMGVDRAQPVTALRETIELIRDLLAGQRTSLDGKVVQFHDGALNFSSRADVEIVVATNGPKTLRLVGEVADGVIVQGMASEVMVHNVRHLLEEGANLGDRVAAPQRLIARLDVCIAEDGDAARDVMRPGIARHLRTHYPRFNSQRLAGIEVDPELQAAVSKIDYGHDQGAQRAVEEMIPESLIAAHCVAGTVEEAATQLAPLLSAGVAEILVMPVPLADQDSKEILQTFANDVMPRARTFAASGVLA